MRPQLAKHVFRASEPILDYKTYWFADVRGGRAFLCSCPGFFNNNILADDTSYLCIHLLRLRDEAVRELHRQAQASDVDPSTERDIEDLLMLNTPNDSRGRHAR